MIRVAAYIEELGRGGAPGFRPVIAKGPTATDIETIVAMKKAKKEWAR